MAAGATEVATDEQPGVATSRRWHAASTPTTEDNAAICAGVAGDPLSRVTIVLPIGPGDTAWPPLLETLRREAAASELLPVFALGDPQAGRCLDGITALTAPAGRAHQLNAGIAAAHGDWLWLLHADSRLRGDTLPALRRWLAQAPRALGWFQLAFERDGPWPMRLNAFGANLRARWLGLPFGDQGFLVRRDDAHRLGPFDPTLPFGEDHAWIWRARRIGLPLRAVGGTLATSARKYAEHGWGHTTWRHFRLTWRQARQESRR